MLISDEGHRFLLDVYDGEQGAKQPLTFMKRCEPSEKYPGNTSSYPGTTIQEVCRALINRLRYVDCQAHDPANLIAILNLREVIWELEARAARKHGRRLLADSGGIEKIATCPTCGHVECVIHEV